MQSLICKLCDSLAAPLGGSAALLDLSRHACARPVLYGCYEWDLSIIECSYSM